MRCVWHVLELENNIQMLDIEQVFLLNLTNIIVNLILENKL